MNAYFTIVLISVVLFFVVWGLGWFLERLSHMALQVTRKPGSRAWYALVGPGVALHESSHALGCVFTRTEIVEFKPVNIEVQGDQVVLGYVKYVNPPSTLKRTIINLAPVAVSLALLTFFALAATYLIPDSHLGGDALTLLHNLIFMKSDPVALADSLAPLVAIGNFVYQFFYTFGQLTVVNPLFWIISFLAMTIMFSNAPSGLDISNALPGLKFIIAFDLIWLVIAYLFPEAGWLAFGVFELLAVMFSLALGFAAIAYGFFIMITSMARLRSPYNILPFAACIGVGFGMAVYEQGAVSPVHQTLLAIAAFVIVILPLLMIKRLRVQA